MYPTISHLIYDLFGVWIPLPIQTFGFWVAIAFIAAAFLLTLELKRKEKEGFLYSTKVKELIWGKLSIANLFSSAILSFLVGFKLVEAVFHYSDFVANPQDFILSFKGSLWGGILIAIISS